MKNLTITILSMSLLTVMAGAAVAPALDAVRAYFAGTDPILIQFIVTMPSFFIILTNLFFPSLCRLWTTRTIALIGLIVYVLAGAGAFFATKITVLLILRALLGVSVGMIMPLSTGLLAYYFPPEKMAHLMGLNASMNQLGGVIATLLAGILASVAWNYAFLVYTLGVFSILLVCLFLPADRLSQDTGKRNSWQIFRHFHPSVVGMLLLMCVFFVYPTNFAFAAHTVTDNTLLITCLMVGLDLVACLTGLAFGQVMTRIRMAAKYIAPLFFMAGYLCLGCFAQMGALVVGSVLVGVATGFGVPYLNTIASIKGGKDSATTVMPLLSAALFAGQFLSPIIISPLSRLCCADDPLGAYKMATIFSLVFLLQALLTRKFHRLPPETDK